MSFEQCHNKYFFALGFYFVFDRRESVETQLADPLRQIFQKKIKGVSQ